MFEQVVAFRFAGSATATGTARTGRTRSDAEGKSGMIT